MSGISSNPEMSSDEAYHTPCVVSSSAISHPDASKENLAPEQVSAKEVRSRPSSCVFVASLSSTRSDDFLSKSVMAHFQQWGTITIVKVLRDKRGRPYAFVQYATDEEAELAIKRGHGTVLDGRAIRCEFAKVNRTVLVMPIHVQACSDAIIRSSLAEYGEIEDVTQASLRTTSIGIGTNFFVRFAYRDDAIRAYAALRSHPDWHAEWTQNLSSVSGEPEPIDRKSVYVGRIGVQATEEMVRERFSKHGEVVSVQLIHPQGHGEMRIRARGDLVHIVNGFAFVEYAESEAAEKAVDAENHTIFLDTTIHVQFKELTPPKYRYTGNTIEFAPPPINLPSNLGSRPSVYPNLQLNRRASPALSSSPTNSQFSANTSFDSSTSEQSWGVLVPSQWGPSAKGGHTGSRRRQSGFDGEHWRTRRDTRAPRRQPEFPPRHRKVLGDLY